MNPSVRGWFNYYGKFYPSMVKITLRFLEQVMVKWMMDKFKRLRGHQRNACHCLGRIARSNPELFVLWQLGVAPALDRTSRMRREMPVRFGEGLGVKLP